MPTVPITSQDVRGRATVHALACVDSSEALNVARAIRHPWYRCQSLSTVAQHGGTQQQKMNILREAFDVAQTQDEINRIVTASSWPLEVMATLAADVAATYASALVDQANAEPHTLRRADALYALACAVENSPPLLQRVVPSLVRALLDGHGWRIDRLIRFTIELVRSTAPEIVAALVHHHREGREKRMLVASLKDFEIQK